MMPKFLKDLFPEMDKPDGDNPFGQMMKSMFGGDDEPKEEEPAPEETPAEEKPAE